MKKYPLNPIISFLMMVRCRTDFNHPMTRDINKFFRDARDVIWNQDFNTVEFLIKFDEDDNYANKAITMLKNNFKHFKIKTFIFRRWEGLYTSHHFYTYLLGRSNRNSRYIGFCGDDAKFNHFSQDVLQQLRDNINNDYIFFTNQQAMVNREILESINYKKVGITDIIMNNHLVEPYPIISKKILEICNGCGFHYNVDTWLGMLNIILAQKYQIFLCKKLPRQTFIRENNKVEQLPSNFNTNMENIPYYINLLEQQAKNIYLNIKYGHKPRS